MPNKNKIILRMAAALLLKKGNLSVQDIQSLPLVDNELLARAVALSLFNRFDLDFNRDVLQLKSNTLIPKNTEKNKRDVPKEELLKILEGKKSRVLYNL